MFPSYAEPYTLTLIDSWLEQRNFTYLAIEALKDHPVRKKVEAALAAMQPKIPERSKTLGFVDDLFTAWMMMLFSSFSGGPAIRWCVVLAQLCLTLCGYHLRQRWKHFGSRCERGELSAAWCVDVKQL